MITVGQNQRSRLIILMPEMLAGNLELARSIACAAKLKERDVIYLVVMDHPNSSLQVTRNMVTMKAMTVTKLVNASFLLIPPSAVVKTLKKYSQPDDAVFIPRLLPDHPKKHRFIPVRLSDRFWLRKILSFTRNNNPAVISSYDKSLRNIADGSTADEKKALDQEEDLL